MSCLCLFSSRSPAHDKSRISGNQTLKLHVEQMVPGSYVFRLIAKSSQGKSSADDVSLTIQNGEPGRLASTSKWSGFVRAELQYIFFKAACHVR